MEESKFWCGTCQNRYTLDKLCLTKVSRGFLQTKTPYIDPESQEKTDTNLSIQKDIYKCPICGFTLKEITDE